MSDIFTDYLAPDFLKKYRWGLVFLNAFLIVLFTEIFIRYFASRPFSKKLVTNSFFLNVAYGIIRIPYFFFRKLIRPKKKIFTNSEADIIRFMNNLSAEGILEKKEVSLINSAFNFDEKLVNSALTPRKKVIFLSENMSYKEIQKIYSKSLFTRYLVLSKKKKVVGIFNFSIFQVAWLKNKDADWQDSIQKKYLTFSPYEKLSVVWEKLQRSSCSLAIVQQEKKIVGIITKNDVLTCLAGKIPDEKDKLANRPNN